MKIQNGYSSKPMMILIFGSLVAVFIASFWVARITGRSENTKMQPVNGVSAPAQIEKERISESYNPEPRKTSSSVAKPASNETNQIIYEKPLDDTILVQ